MAVDSDSSSVTAGLLPRLIVSDLDGTFLSPDGTVSSINREAIAAAQRAGVVIIFATGRPVRWLDVITDLPGAHPMVIASNGAVLYDAGEARVVRRHVIEVAVAAESISRLRAAIPGVCFAFEAADRFDHEPAYSYNPAIDTLVAVRSGPAEDLIGSGDHVKLMARHAEFTSDELADRATATLGDLLTVTHSSQPASRLIELSRRGVSKASMLIEVCTELGVDLAEVAAFGDMPNDLEMLSVVGRPHIMANAHPLLHALEPASPITVVPSNAESGVGTTIAGWLTDCPR